MSIIIKTVRYRHLLNLGNYENEAIELEADVPPDKTPEEVIAMMRAFTRRYEYPRITRERVGWATWVWEHQGDFLDAEVEQAHKILVALEPKEEPKAEPPAASDEDTIPF